MRVLITGGAGYLGNALTRLALDLGYSVDVVDNLLFGQGSTQFDLIAHPRYKFHRVDVRDCARLLPLVAKADAIIALAALVGAPVCERFPQYAESVNFRAIKWLVDNISKSQRIIYPNTNSGYGTVPTGVCTEETPMHPISIYGSTKSRAEAVVLEHPNSVAFRLATVYGTSARMRLDLLVNQLTFLAVRTKMVTVFDRDLRRNYVHVNDIAKCFLAATNNAWRGVYNLGLDAANMTKGQLAQLVAEVVGAEVKVASGSDPDRRDYLVSSAKLTKAGFAASIGLREGIQDVARLCALLPPGDGVDAEIGRMSTTRPDVEIIRAF